ncbi:MAG: glycerol-3-phosphate acyltransferase PlsY [Verrucomicrobiales bacterium]|jgi:glycerol-3-phosphate acyltransferase PlsY
MTGISEITALVASYVFGATPFGYLAGRLRGMDIRQHGSGNIGATNAFRVLGKPTGIVVFVLDFLKGLLPVLITCKVFPDAPLAPVLAGVGTILGHNFTFWLGFRGGKGIATSAGVLLALLPIAMLIGLGVWLSLFFATRYVAVASIGAAFAIPIVTAIRDRENLPLLIFSIAIGALAIVRHRPNIQRLMAGTENRFTRKSKTK